MKRSLKIGGWISAVLVTGAAVTIWLMLPGSLPACDARDYAEAEIAAVRAMERADNPDSLTSASLAADARPAAVWDVVEHFETVWPASNPSHVQTCVVTSPETVHENMIYHDVERVGGITATMYAHVYDVIPERQFRWKANARYDLGLVALPVRQGGWFQVEPEGDDVRISHEVWAEFPDTTTGRVAEWAARNLMSMERSAIEHNRVELEYFRDRAEAAER